jgi:ATP-dependent Clp protease ATP-binding subunit ClpA
MNAFQQEERGIGEAISFDCVDQLIGMAEAKKAIHRIWKDALLNIGSRTETKSVLLVGPPGTGKTELCKIASRQMGRTATFLQMSSADAVKSQIYSALAQDPARVIILDELEKASRQAQEELLEVLQNGEFTPVCTQKALFFATSNAGSGVIQERSLVDDRTLRTQLVRDGLSEPVISRFQAVVAVRNPSLNEFKAALKTQLDSMLRKKGEKLQVTLILGREGGFLETASQLYQPEYGYRKISRMVSHLVERAIDRALQTARSLNRVFTKDELVLLHWHPTDLDPFQVPSRTSLAPCLKLIANRTKRFLRS